MSKTRNFLCWSLVIIGALCILNLPFTARAREGNPVEGLNELSATVNIQVSWNKHDETSFSNLEETGSMSALITGTLTLDKQQKGVFLFFPESKGMNAEVKYKNVTKDKKSGELYLEEEGSGSVQVLSPRFVTDPQAQGHFEFMAFTGPGGIAHALSLSGQVDIDSLTKAMASQENMDHYTFSVATPIQTVVTDKDGNSKDGLRGIHFVLVAEALKDGAISNSLSWTAEKIKYSIGHQNFMGTVYDPPKSGDVNYTVNWTFGEAGEAIQGEESEDDKENERPCYIIKCRIMDTKVNKKLYSNETIKDYYKNKFGEEGFREYNNGIEKIAEHVYVENFQTAAEAEQFIDSLTEDDIKWMENNPPPPPSGGGTPPSAVAKAKLSASVNVKDPCDIRDMTLIGYLGEGGNRTEVNMIEFECKNNEYIGKKTENYQNVEEQYKQEYGPEAGEALFESMVKHEMTHKQQYEQRCFPDTIDKVSEYEMEAYSNEIDSLEEHYYYKLKCD